MSHRRPEDADREAQLTRRDLLQGKLGRLLAKRSDPSKTNDSAPTKQQRVMRYPRSAVDLAGRDSEPSSDEQTLEPVQSINGISIAPVPRTGDQFKHSPGAQRRSIPVFRPPGAIVEQAFLNNCTRCSECIKSCPHDAIILAPDRMRGVAGTPILDPDSQPCLMCADYPCINACEPGVLTETLPKMMGTARVTEHLCLAHHGTPCMVCSEACPVEQAIAVTDGKPTVREDLCTGCGVCRNVCPAPENAILLMPTFNRPAASITDAANTSREIQ